MIKLTALYYKLTEQALEKHHNVKEFAAKRIFDWEKELAKAQTVGGDYEYPNKPFIEPFEFENDDYDVTEQQYRIRAEDIVSYRTNLDGHTDLTDCNNLVVTVKETVEEIDKLIE